MWLEILKPLFVFLETIINNIWRVKNNFGKFFTFFNTLTAANTSYISLPTDQKIWKPDTFFRWPNVPTWVCDFWNMNLTSSWYISSISVQSIISRNEVSGKRHSILQDNSYIRLFPDGMVQISTRWSSSGPRGVRYAKFLTIQYLIDIVILQNCWYIGLSVYQTPIPCWV